MENKKAEEFDKAMCEAKASLQAEVNNEINGDTLPDCMMPDGAEPCLAFKRLKAMSEKYIYTEEEFEAWRKKVDYASRKNADLSLALEQADELAAYVDCLLRGMNNAELTQRIRAALGAYRGHRQAKP